MKHIPEDSLQKRLEEIITKKLPESLNFDFKQEWYKSNAALLLDIICFANNLSGPFSFIVIGVTDSYELIGVPDTEMPASKWQDKITDILKKTHFSGEYRPDFYVTTLSLSSKRIDVIVIDSDSKNVPFFLSERYEKGGVVGTEIYTRIQGTNSEKYKNADRPTIEKLWRKHFELNYKPRPLDLLKQYLGQPNHWIDNHEKDGFNSTVFYGPDPNFALYFDRDSCDREERHQTIYQFIQTDSTPISYTIKVLIGCRVVDCLEMRELDGGRLDIPTPKESFIHTDHWDQAKSFRYFTLDSLDYFILFFCFYFNPNSEAEIALMKMLKVVDLYENENEVEAVKRYIQLHMSEYSKIEKEVSNDPLLIGNVKSSEKSGSYKDMHERIITTISAMKLHEKWRQERGLKKLLFGDGI